MEDEHATERRERYDEKRRRNVCVCVCTAYRMEEEGRGKEKIRVKFRHCEMTRVVFIAATPAERDAPSSRRASVLLLLFSALPCIDKSVGRLLRLS